jgi:G3E family GTPase
MYRKRCRKVTEIILLTGFLGAGKTTFMRSLLDTYQDKKIGVIVNEFGERNIDGETLEKEGILMEELSNGSIFCACIKDNFLSSLIYLSKKDLEYVFIEASGLSDPSSIGQILETIKPKTVKPYSYKGAIGIVDADIFDKVLLVSLVSKRGTPLKGSSFSLITREAPRRMASFA